MHWGHGMQRCQPVPGSSAQDPRAALCLTLRKSCWAKAEPFGFASPPSLPPLPPPKERAPSLAGPSALFCDLDLVFPPGLPPLL